MFYTFTQNNSGGSFIGPRFVIVEADSADEANDIAERSTPVYFDGTWCRDGCDVDPYESCACMVDCYCCGDRWSRVSEYAATERPEIYGEPVSSGPDGIIIYR